MVKFRLMRALAALLCTVALAGCGGGGGRDDAPGGSQGGTFQATFGSASVDANGIEGTAQPLALTAQMSFTGEAANSGVYLRAGGDKAVILDVKGQLVGTGLNLTVTLRGDLTPGDHATEFLLFACYDEACTRSPAGSPVRLPIRYHVQPNIQVEPVVALSRQGREDAPTATLPVTIPPEAGTVTMLATNNRPEAIDLKFDGSALKVSTRQVPAGRYDAIVTFRSNTDERYMRTVQVVYTVTAPAEGEQALSVVEPYRNFSVQQGSGLVQHISVTRPTWTSAWDEPQVFYNDSNILTLTPAGDGGYDVAINTAGLAPGDYQPMIYFSAGPTGGTASVSFYISVRASFYVADSLIHTLTATSTTADLAWTNAVLTFDGVPARWTAVSQSPLLQVVNGSGQTGTDAIQLKLDPAALSQPDWGLALPVTVSIDRAGTVPQTVQFSVWNVIPTVQSASPSTLVGSSGRVYLQGSFRYYDGDPLTTNSLRVEGATLSHGQLIADRRYLSDLLVLALDLTGATPGQPVRVHVDSALLPTEVELQVQAPLRAALGYQALDYGSYRPGQFSPGLGAFYFSRPGFVYRWAPGPGGWSLTQASVPGLLDVAPGPDERKLFATTPTQLLALHAVTFAQQSAGTLTDWSTSIGFDTGAAGARALSFSADGRALASILDASSPPQHNIETVCTMPSTRAVPALTAAPQSCDPGSAKGWAWGPSPSGTVRSANGSIVVGVNPNGARSSYPADERQWLANTPLPAGVIINAVSDSGLRLVRSDGIVINADGASLGNLGAVVPFTHVIGGYGLSSGGRFGLVYGYRITSSDSTQRATDAVLWVLDLNNAAWEGVASAPVIAAISLPDALGCTGSFVQGETCVHRASITVAPGDGTAFLVGPRGVAAVALPAVVTPVQPLSTRGRPGARAARSAPAASQVMPPSRGFLKAKGG